MTGPHINAICKKYKLISCLLLNYSLFNCMTSISQIKNNTPKLTNVVVGLREPLRLLLSYRSDERPDEHEFLKVRYFFYDQSKY